MDCDKLGTQRKLGVTNDRVQLLRTASLADGDLKSRLSCQVILHCLGKDTHNNLEGEQFGTRKR